jgi:hypothetical protein
MYLVEWIILSRFLDKTFLRRKHNLKNQQHLKKIYSKHGVPDLYRIKRWLMETT